MLDKFGRIFELDPQWHEPSPAEERRFDVQQAVGNGLRMINDAYPRLVAIDAVAAEVSPSPQPSELSAPAAETEVIPQNQLESQNTSADLSVEEMQQQVEAAFEPGLGGNPLFDQKS